jgi:tetratricopeptide (TPR) repeat protein
VRDVSAMSLPATNARAAQLTELDSFKLFRERAREKKSNWEVGEPDVANVANILEATEGIPLAIELAAARVGDFALGDVARGLAKSRMTFLQRAGPAVEERRHASMNACLDWSFNLLSEAEKALFLRVSIFSGGFFAEDVDQICGSKDAIGLLDSLRAHSLLSWTEAQDRTRYQMLGTARDYAATKLGSEAPELRHRHAAHFLKELQSADRQLGTGAYAIGLARIDADLENIFAGAAACSAGGNHSSVIAYGEAFAGYLKIKGRFGERLDLAQKAKRAAEALGEPEVVAGRDNNLGNAYIDLPTGDRGENLERAIASYGAALRVYTERDFPQRWAGIQNNLGVGYRDLPTGDRGDNLKRAIAYFESALRVHTERDFPRDWARTQNNLGTAYGNLTPGDRGENLARAITCLEATLRVYTERDFPRDWAMAQNNLGNAYIDLPTGDRSENLARAIACFEAALRVYTERDFPQDWAMAQNNLGAAYTDSDLPTVDRGENLERAVASYKAALRVYTERDFPQQWAATQVNLGIAYGDLPTGDRGENLERAIACFEAAARGFETAGLLADAGRLSKLIASLRKG